MKKNHKFIHLGIIFSIIFIWIIILFLKGYIFGSSIDWANQHIVIPEYFRNLFYETKKLIPTFALNLGLGQNIFNFSYYGLFSPIILLSYLFPFIPMTIYMPLASITSLLISISLFYKWINSKYNAKIAFLATFIFAFNAPFIYHFHRHIMFVIYMPFMINALRGIDTYFENKKILPLIINTTLLIFTSYYFSVPCIIGLGIYTLYKLLNTKFESKKLFSIIYYVTIAILISGILLLPTAYALLNGRLTTLTSNTSLLTLLNPLNNYKYTFYNSYYGFGITFIYLLSIAYGLSSKKKGSIFLSIILLLCIIFPLTSYTLNVFMYIDGKCFIPLLPIFMLLICELLNKLFTKEISLKPLFITILISFIPLTFSAINNNNLSLFLIDISLLTASFILLKKKNNSYLLYASIIILALLTFNKSQNNEIYMKINDIKSVNNEAYYELTTYIDTDTLYRTSNRDNIIYTPNKVYNENYLTTTMYSSSVNKYYMNFIRNIFQNEVINRDNTTVTQTNNLLFNIYTGTKYLLTKNDALLGYEKVASLNNINLYKNEDVLPIAYVSNKLMSRKEFLSLEYPNTIDALLNYVIVDENIENVYTSNIKTYTGNYEMLEQENLEIKNINNHYQIRAEENASLKIKLNENLENEILIIKFKMNKEKEGNACSSNITINNITNALSCSNWKYHNNNFTFEYVLDSNNILDIKFTKGEYDIDDVNIYTMNYDVIKNINVDEVSLTYENDTLRGTVNVSNDGYLKISIPYDKGFKIYVDGDKTDIELVDETFLGVKITKGNHEIEIKYNPPYLKAGIITSLVGITFLITTVTIRKYKKK